MVVNDESGVHPATAERVLTAIDQLGFRRNLGARNLRRGVSSGTIGVLLEDVANPFYSVLTRAVEEVARQFGRHVLTGSSDEDPERERELALEFCARRVDGLLVVPAGLRHGYLVPEIHAGLPVVFDSIEDFVNRSSALIGSPQQVIDKVGRYHEQLGHEVIHLSAEADGVTVAQKRRSLELFQSDVAPVPRDQIASRPLAAQSSRKEVVL